MTELTTPQEKLGVLFVCTGNICRSPTAEGVFRHLLAQEGLQDRVAVDSAGTHGYHVGARPDRRSTKAAALRGYDLGGLEARLLSDEDFVHFDYLLAMDRDHLAVLRALAPMQHNAKVAMMLDFSSRFRGIEVPDPYYGGPQGFEHVLDLIEDGASGLLAEIKHKLGL